MPVRRIEPDAGYAKLFDLLKPELSGDSEARAQHFRRFQELGFPNQRAEAWKYTSVKALAERAPSASRNIEVTREQVEPYVLGGDVWRMVFVNGVHVPALGNQVALPAGVAITSAEAAQAVDDEHGSAAQSLRALTALNAAFTRGGARIDVADGVIVEPFVQLLFVQVGDAAAMANPYNVVRVGAGAKLRMAETHVALADGGFTNLVNHFVVDDEGELVVDKLQLGRPGSALIGQSAMRIGREARLAQTTVTCGGALVRNESVAKIDGTEADLDLNGVYVPTAGEQVDTSIRIEHNAPNCESNQFYKGILGAGGHGVFAGKIFVDQVAQKTNAYQQNDNLMLSRDAEIDTKPELEIYADDVKCSHGATVGELDATGLFYLRSRGIERSTAEAILTFAFAGEVVERLTHEDSKHHARQAILDRLDGGDKLKELV